MALRAIMKYVVYLVCMGMFFSWYFIPGSIDTNAFITALVVGMISLMFSEAQQAKEQGTGPQEHQAELRSSRELDVPATEEDHGVELSLAGGLSGAMDVAGDGNAPCGEDDVLYPDDDIRCRFSIPSREFGDWIALFKRNVVQWEYVQGRCCFVHAQSGELVFSGDKSAHVPGEYQFRYYRFLTTPLPSTAERMQKRVAERVEDLVKDSPLEKLTQRVNLPIDSKLLGCSRSFTVCAPRLAITDPAIESMMYGGKIVVEYTASCKHSNKDWVGLYMCGTPNGRTNGKWGYAPGRSGRIVFSGERAPPRPGRYELRMHRDDGYEVLAVSRQIKVNGPVLELKIGAGKDSIALGSGISVRYVASAQRSPSDWIEVHKAGTLDGEWKGKRFAVEGEEGELWVEASEPGQFCLRYHADTPDGTSVWASSAPFFVE